jgi:hypothetical protein
MRRKPPIEEGVEPLQEDNFIAAFVFHQLQEEHIVLDDYDQAVSVDRGNAVVVCLVLAIQHLQ